MPKYVLTTPTFTPEAVADATNFVNDKHLTVQGGSSTALTKITGVSLGGLHGSSSPMIMILGRNSTVAVTPAVLTRPASFGLLNPRSTAPASPPLGFMGSTTKSQRSNDVALGSLAFPINGYAGRVQWVAPPGGEFWLYGNAASIGEASLTGYTGSTLGLLGGSIGLEAE